MKLLRPYIPLKVRVEVAFRQMFLKDMAGLVDARLRARPDRERLDEAIHALFGKARVHLDHCPPLMLRERRRDGTYVPDANDPEFLVYRSKEDHRTKTFVRGDGAQRSDMGQRRYLKKVAANRKPKRKHKWPKRKLKGRSSWVSPASTSRSVQRNKNS